MTQVVQSVGMDRSGGVEWPDRRADVMEGLNALATLRGDEVAPWPDLTNAVHWVVDDTGWDQRSPEGDIGLLLADAAEAEAVARVLEPLLVVSEKAGVSSDDAIWFQHARWHEVSAAAAATDAVLAAQGRR